MNSNTETLDRLIAEINYKPLFEISKPFIKTSLLLIQNIRDNRISREGEFRGKSLYEIVNDSSFHQLSEFKPELEQFKDLVEKARNALNDYDPPPNPTDIIQEISSIFNLINRDLEGANENLARLRIVNLKLVAWLLNNIPRWGSDYNDTVFYIIGNFCDVREEDLTFNLSKEYLQTFLTHSYQRRAYRGLYSELKLKGAIVSAFHSHLKGCLTNVKRSAEDILYEVNKGLSELNYARKKLVENKKRIHTVIYDKKLSRCCLFEEIDAKCQETEQIRHKIEEEKIFGFFMYQFQSKDKSGTVNDVHSSEIKKIKELIQEINEDPLVEIEPAENATELGVKICEFCRIARSYDFGIALLSPVNGNVYLEIGLFLSLGKKVIFLNNELTLERVPFDVTPFFYVPYKNLKQLEDNWNQKVPQTIKRIKDFYLRSSIDDLVQLIPKTEKEYNNINEILHEIDEKQKGKLFWEVYCLSKFLVCYILFTGLKSVGYRLDSLMSSFSELERRDSGFDIPFLFERLGFLEVFSEFNKLIQNIREVFSPLSSENEIILQWTDISTIDEILKKTFPKKNPDELRKIVNQSEKVIAEHRFQDERWLKKYHIDPTSDVAKVNFFKTSLKITRKKIEEEFAISMKNIAFKFCKKFFLKLGANL